MRKIFLIANAHIDPVWQWEWEEGAAEAISTFRVAAQFCEDFDGFVFNHNEALLYQWIEQFEPSLFAKIQKLVAAGKWHIMGGWHLQPDCNMPSGEAFVRQIKAGRRYFLEKFGKAPTTAINFDPFGHNRGLVQIMKKSGYDSYLFMRPSEQFIHLPGEVFRWEGFDGSSVMGYRTPNYGSAFGDAVKMIGYRINVCPENGKLMALWGMGDHGGGPSRQDLIEIGEFQKKMAAEGVEIVHATPEEFFAEVDPATLPVWDDELNPWAPGCYSSMALVKSKYRQTENRFFLTERMAAAADANGVTAWPGKELSEAEYDFLTVQFHDMLPGSSIQPAEDMAIRFLDHGAENLSRAKCREFISLAGGQKRAEDGKIPILAFNPHPYPVEGDFFAEMMLGNQNWAEGFAYPHVVDEDGNPVPSQCEKEHSSLNLDWRKRSVFHATLKPMQMNRFDVYFEPVPARPKATATEDEKYVYLHNKRVNARISKTTGCLESYVLDGRERLSGPVELTVMKDNCDPWGMNVTSFTEKEGTFRLLDEDEGQKLCGIHARIPSVRPVESGEVRNTIEVLMGYGASRAIVRYTLSQNDTDLTVDVRVQWMEKQRLIKLMIPTTVEKPRCFGQVAFGEQEFKLAGRENCSQKYLMLRNENDAAAVINDGVYGSHFDGSTLFVTLMRSPAYCAHPIQDREIIMQDRYTPHMEQGERLFRLAMVFGDTETVVRELPRRAAVFNEPPMVLSFFPTSEGEKPQALVTATGDPVEFPALKKADDGNGYILRAFNPWDHPAEAVLHSAVFACDQAVSFGKFEVKTFRLTEKGFAETDLLEGLLDQPHS